MNRAIFACLLGLCCTAHAEVTAIGLHTVTYHSRSPAHGEWNNVNPGLYAKTDSGYVFGTLKNSEFKQSFYAGLIWETKKVHGLSGHLTAGAITGYAKPVQPLLSFGVSYAVTDCFAVQLNYLPKPPKTGSSAVHLSLEWSLK